MAAVMPISELANDLTRRNVPDFDPAEAVADDQRGSVWSEGKSEMAVVAVVGEALAGPRVPAVDEAVAGGRQDHSSIFRPVNTADIHCTSVGEICPRGKELRNRR